MTVVATRDREQLDRVVDVVRSALGDAVVGAYLFGSVVRGGLRPASDLDVLVVVARPLTDREVDAVIAGLLPISGRGDPSGQARPLELTVVVASAVRPWRYPPPIELQYGDWWRAELERRERPWSSPNPDAALLIHEAVTGDHPLLGPPPADVLDPIPEADRRRAMLAGVPGLLADLDGDERNVLLTFARIWMSVATGEMVPKDVAADWVLERLPDAHRPVLARARASYRGEGPDDLGDLRSAVRPCVDWIAAQIAALDDAS